MRYIAAQSVVDRVYQAMLEDLSLKVDGAIRQATFVLERMQPDRVARAGLSTGECQSGGGISPESRHRQRVRIHRS